jgi:hypothetical protein
MEAATPLRPPHIRLLGDRVVLDGVVVDDACLVRLVREREEAGEDTAKIVLDALGIGARVLDREQTAADTEWVKAEFERVSREVEASFSDRARVVAEHFGAKVDEVFSPESGHLHKALGRHFSDESSAAVQHRVKALVGEVMAKSREDLLRQFSAADGSNPLADFKAGTLAALRQGSERQDANLRALLEKMGALERELQGLRDEKEKQLELLAERERGTAKGRTFEEEVHEAVDRIAVAQGDDCDAVGDLLGATRKTGDVLVALDACRGPARGRIVFEAKNQRLSKPKAIEELDRALTERNADYAVLVVPSEDKVPAKMLPLREYNGDKLIVPFDPDEGSQLALEVGYSLARARVLMAGGGEGEIDTAAIGETVERALGAMDEVRSIKLKLTGATTSIEAARSVLDAMSARVREQLEHVRALLAAEGRGSAPG